MPCGMIWQTKGSISSGSWAYGVPIRALLTNMISGTNCWRAISAPCPTGAINDFIPLRPMALITEKCIGCGKCMKVCPVDAAAGEKKKLHTVDTEKCTGCGICTANCPVMAIEGTFNTAKVLEAAAKKKQ